MSSNGSKAVWWVMGVFVTVLLLTGGAVIGQGKDIAVLQTEYRHITEKLDDILDILKEAN